MLVSVAISLSCGRCSPGTCRRRFTPTDTFTSFREPSSTLPSCIPTPRTPAWLSLHLSLCLSLSPMLLGNALGPSCYPLQLQALLLLLRGNLTFAAESVVHRPAASLPSGSLLDMQHPRPHPRPSDSAPHKALG